MAIMKQHRTFCSVVQLHLWKIRVRKHKVGSPMFPIIWSHVLDTAHLERGMSKRKKATVYDFTLIQNRNKASKRDLLC